VELFPLLFARPDDLLEESREQIRALYLGSGRNPNHLAPKALALVAEGRSYRVISGSFGCGECRDRLDPAGDLLTRILPEQTGPITRMLDQIGEARHARLAQPREQRVSDQR
jgi:hypothetical protein